MATQNPITADVALGRLTSAAARAQAQLTHAPTPNPWILNPWVDILLVCGGAVWLLMLLDRSARGEGLGELLAGLGIVSLAGTHLLANSHTAATLFRIFKDTPSSRPYHLYRTWLLAGTVALGLYGATNAVVAMVFLKIYLLWVMQHYTAQCYGITLLYCYKRGYPVKGFSKRALQSFYQLIWVYAVVSACTFPVQGKFLGLPVPFWGPLPEWIFQAVQIALAASIVVNLALIGRVWWQNRVWLPAPALILMGSTFAFLTVSGPGKISFWLYIPAFFHATQYLLLTASYSLKEDALERDPSSLDRSSTEVWRLLVSRAGLRYFLVLMLLGAFIYQAAPAVIQDFGANLKVASASVFAVINFHHFLTDRAIWKLRDPKVRGLLLR